MRNYPSTSCFPRNPENLTREDLESVYIDLRQNYRGLSVSRGRFATKAAKLQWELEKLDLAFDQLSAQLIQEAENNHELQSFIVELKAVSQRQKQLVSEVRREFEAVRGDRGNIIEKFNRIMRAVYQLLNQDVGDLFNHSPQNSEREEDWTDESPRGVGRSLLDR